LSFWENTPCSVVYYRGKKDDLVLATLFPDLLFPYIPNRAQNDNRGSILAYSLFGRFLVTGFIGAFLNPYFQIPGIWAWNPKSPILRGEKPALLFPFGWQIAVQMGWSRGNEGKRPVLGVVVLRDLVWLSVS